MKLTDKGVRDRAKERGREEGRKGRKEREGGKINENGKKIVEYS